MGVKFWGGYSPPSPPASYAYALATSPVAAGGVELKSSPQGKSGEEQVAAIEKRHESVDEKVCCDLSHLITMQVVS